jgi:Flp pilus assembly protein TadD
MVLAGVPSPGLESASVATSPPHRPSGTTSAPTIPFRLGLGPEDGAEAPPPVDIDEEALGAFRRAAWLHPEEADYHYILGEALLRTERFTEAAAAFEEATWRRPADPQYQLGLGIALRAVGRYVEAASAFREAIRLVPRDPRAHGGLGACLAALGQEAEGIRAFRQAASLAPADVGALFNLSLALILAHQADEALVPLRQAATLAPGDALARAELGGALHALGRDVEAYATFGEALRLDPRCLDSEPRLRAARDASAIVAMKEGIREDLAGTRSPWSWALRPVVLLFERLPSLPSGLGRVLSLGFLCLVLYVTARLVPPYWNHYSLMDEVARIAHAPLRDDTEIRARVMAAAEERHLGRYVGEGQLNIDTRRTWRRITCRYAIPVALVPGFEPRLRFTIDVEEPVLIDGEEKIFF